MSFTTALASLIPAALPGLFTGQGKVGLKIGGAVLAIDPMSTEGAASDPRPDDRADRFEIDATQITGPYRLSQPPYPGPRRVRLATTTGGYVTLRAEEVVWDRIDGQQFTLALRPNRDPTSFEAVQVLYGVTAIFTKLRATQTVNIELESTNASKLEQAAALVVAVFQLNQAQVIADAAALYEDGDYGAQVDVKSLRLDRVESVSDSIRRIMLLGEIELKLTRALPEDEGLPIRTILTPGQSADDDRPVVIEPEIDV